MSFIRCGIVLASLVFVAGQVRGELVVLDQFNPGLGELVSAAFDQTTDRVWVYNSFGAVLSSYSRSGTFVSSVAQPGEGADDFDLSFAPEPLVLNGTPLPAGTLLSFNGESGAVDIYAVDKTSGAVLATLTTAFGSSHVVGGAYHPGRDSFFVVQDRNTSSLIAEIDPSTGAVLNTFGTSSADYTIFFGDLEISSANGNLFLVSSDESSMHELTATGSFVQDLALPAGVSSLSGMSVDNVRGETWVSGTGGTVWRLGGLPAAVPEASGLFLCLLTAAALLRSRQSTV
jgi:hypothetical protein